MSVYRGILEFEGGRIIDELWVNKEDALSYFERTPNFTGIIRAELMELIPGDKLYESKECLYEYDVNGHYYYQTEKRAM